MPTLDLAAQTALAWRADGHGEHMVIVSSLDAAVREDLVAARVMSTTSPHALGGLMSMAGRQRTRCWPRPATGTAPATSPTTTYACSLSSSTGTGRPRTPYPPSWGRHRPARSQSRVGVAARRDWTGRTDTRSGP
ncbi:MULTISPECIES: hypothetical protein [Streptomyces]|uniref:hypothetical protein n=1 Tax=Streptomyces TaxID=1883 RepID=UPI002D21EA04|nr:hypothetical protein [Streptomyces sp. NRRL F-3307]